ncbi:MAG: hypothetical protein MJB14_07185, partial [Spirochaetes bacterium]|nr:hypothetical protein [Spirochaetota bacterium]
FLTSTYYAAFLASREDNPGARIEIDYQNDFVKTFADVDKTTSQIKITGQEGDGAGSIIREIEYDSISGLEYAAKEMAYDNYGRMITLTDPDADPGSGVNTIVDGQIYSRYDKTWVVVYDDLGRKTKVLYPGTSDKTDTKTIIYDDINNIVTTVDPEQRMVEEYYDWNGNLVKVGRYGDNSTSAEKYEFYEFEYDELKRKTKFTDAMGLITTYLYDERNLLLEQDYGNGKDMMTYNNLGQLETKTDRKGQVIAFTYDQMGRNTKATHYLSIANYQANTIDHTVELAYDNRGNAVRIANPNLIEHYVYDYANRVITLERRLKDTALRTKLADTIWSGPEADQVFTFQYQYN